MNTLSTIHHFIDTCNKGTAKLRKKITQRKGEHNKKIQGLHIINGNNYSHITLFSIANQLMTS